MDQVAEEKTISQAISEAIEHIKLWELEIIRIRDHDPNRNTIHPWAFPSLANAIGSLQAAQSHLRAAKHHIETPEPPIDASFEVVK